MSIVFKARGSSSFGLLLIRLAIGLTFLLAGAHKATDVEGFIGYVKSLNVLPPNMAFVMGFILPFAEILFGAFYIIGIFTPLTSLVLSVMIISFTATTGGATGAEVYTIPVFAYYMIMLACTLTTMFGGAGVVSFDALFDKKKTKREVKVEEKTPEAAKPPADIKEAEFTEVGDQHTERADRTDKSL
ncbi:MAG: DoxX family protein [Bacteroidetes bacterium]|nr:DoxX family protein [Bacteroidota bacterium]